MAAKAKALADKLDKEYPEDTQVQATYVPTLRALAALDRNDPRKAIDLLEANRPYEFGIPPLAFIHFYGNMYPIYIRGLAYLAMRKAEEAAVEFSRLLAHPGLAAGDPVEAAARRQLARALGLAGDKTKARSAYQDFLASWKDADLTSRFSSKLRRNSLSYNERLHFAIGPGGRCSTQLPTAANAC